MMKKNYYIKPAFKVVALQPARMLMQSGGYKSMRWSGGSSGDSGPEGIDDNSTYDSF